MNQFYMIDSSGDGDSFPLFFDAEWVPDLPEIDWVSKTPSLKDFYSSYNIRAYLDRLSVDVIFEQFLASSDFVSLCDDLGCGIFTIPVTVELNGQERPEKSYSFFLATKRLSILDRKFSRYELMHSGLLRSDSEIKDDVPVYDRIDFFSIRPGVDQHLFFCEETKQMACTDVFRSEFEKRKMTGLEFTLIDEEYKYAPWDDF